MAQASTRAALAGSQRRNVQRPILPSVVQRVLTAVVCFRSAHLVETHLAFSLLLLLDVIQPCSSLLLLCGWFMKSVWTGDDVFGDV